MLLDRRNALRTMAGGCAFASATASPGRADAPRTGAGAAGPLKAPDKGSVNVAVLVSESATVIDFAGPWEVFQDVHVPSRGATMAERMPFSLYTVAVTADPITASAGLRILPNHTFETAPRPDVVVIGAQAGGRDPRFLEGVKRYAETASLVMSVCTGAFIVARTGLLDGLEATTHHDFYDEFEKSFPKVELRRGLRFVESGPRIATAGGLTSGVDLALRVVERYFGREVAQKTADYMEYQSAGWKV
jgi:transcriptional regulator GlxA family with amidase domain